MFRVVGAVVEATFKQLDSDDGEDELKEHVDDHNVENVLQRVDDAVKHRLSITQNVANSSYKWSKNFDKRPHRMPCRYQVLDDFFCCLHRSRDSRCFSVGRTTPQKIAPSVGDFDPQLIHGSFGPNESAPTASRLVQPFLHSISVRLTHRQTHRPRYV